MPSRASTPSPAAERRSPLSAALSAAALLSLAACGGGGDAGVPEAMVQDSAGVVLVTHSGDAAFPTWTAEVDERVGFEGDFFRVSGAVALSNGNHMVANGGTHTLQLFGPGGEALRSMGGRGEGPGEFQGLHLLARVPGDSVLAFDLNLRRASLFGADGGFGRTFALETNEEAPFGQLRGVHGDGSLLATGFSRTPDGGPEYGRQWYPAPIFRHGPDGSYRGRLPEDAGGEGYFEGMGGGGFAVFSPLFPRMAHVAVGPGRVVVASNDRWDMGVFSPDGALTHRIRMNGLGPRTITPALHRDAIERALDESTSGRDPDELRRIYEAMELPPELPAHGRVLVDRLDHLWVERYAPIPGETSEWLVFSPQGEAAGRVVLPTRFAPHDIGDDFLLGVLFDDLEVEQVVRIPLRR